MLCNREKAFGLYYTAFHRYTKQAFRRDFSYVLLGVFERLGGPQVKALHCAPKDCGWGRNVATAALSHFEMPFCTSLSPALSIVCTSCSGQGLLCITLCAGISSLWNAEELVLYYY